MGLPRLTQPGARPTTIRAEVWDCPKSLAPSILRLGEAPGGPHRSAHDFYMRAASAQIMAQGFEHVGLGRMRGAHQQRLGAHDHAVETVATLRGLFPDEGVLHRIGMIACAKTLERHNVALDAAADRDNAGPRHDAVNEYGTGPAFAEPAAVFRSVQFKIVAQHVEQRGLGVSVDVVDPAVDCQADRGLRHAYWFRPGGCAAKHRGSNPPRRYRLHTNVQACLSAGRNLLPGLCGARAPLRHHD